MRKVFSILLFLIFCLPLTQYRFGIFKKDSLHAVSSHLTKPKLNFSNFYTGNYQSQFENYYLKKSGFYETFTKLNNSFNYNIFNLASGRYDQTIMGKNGNLFERLHLKDLNALNNAPISLISKLKKIKRLQDYLKSKNINFILVINPNKILLEQEDILPSFIAKNNMSRPIINAEKALKKMDINYLNLSSLLPKKVFTHSGAHLTNYGKCKSVELISKKLNNVKQILPEFECIPIGLAEPEGEDLDLGKLINVFSYEKSKEQVTKYKIEIKKEAQVKKLLLIGTSFGFGLLQELKKIKAFDEYNFLFYNKTVYKRENVAGDSQRSKTKQTSEFHNLDYIKKFDLVIMEITEPRINQVGSVFIKNLNL